MGWECGYGLVGSLLRISEGCSQGVGPAVFSSGGVNGEESTSRLIQVASRIHFLVGVGLMFLFSCRLSAGGLLSDPCYVAPSQALS